MAEEYGRWIIGSVYRDILGADDPPGAPPRGDLIIAGPGNDFLIGDVGADLFGFNPGDGLDYIADFTPGEDKLQFGSGLTAASLTIRQEAIFGIPGTSIYYDGPNGMNSIVLRDVTALQPGDIVFGDLPARVIEYPRGDLNNDERSDLLLRGPDGTVALWRLDGTTVADRSTVGMASADWSVVGTGDFNANGTQDLVLQQQAGPLLDWSRAFSGAVTPFPLPDPGPGWRALQTGHFDDDPAADLLFQHADGRVAIWFMGGWQNPDGTVAAMADVGNPGAAWKVAGVGDFNRDYRTDILLQDTNGTLVQWLMDGAAVTAATTLGSLPAGTRVAGTGDLDGDGRDDILLRQADGSLTLWSMNGGTVTATTPIASPGPDWAVAATGDYDGNGRDDILLRNTDGALSVWLMEGARVATAAIIGNPGTDWQVA